MTVDEVITWLSKFPNNRQVRIVGYVAVMDEKYPWIALEELTEESLRQSGAPYNPPVEDE